MARLFSWGPSLRFRGRKFKGLRGFAGKPFHPPLTDIPVAAYILTAVFDVISVISYAGDETSRAATDFFRAATYTLIAGAIASVPTLLTGFWDWLKSTPRGTQAWRTANSHLALMATTSVLVVIGIFVRLGYWEENYTELPVLVLSLLVALFVSWGSFYGGALVYEMGFNVETAADSPYWHESDTDIYHPHR